MVLKNWIPQSQSGRIAASFITSLIFVCVLFSGFLAEIAVRPEWNAVNLTILCSVATFTFLFSLATHPLLYFWSLGCRVTQPVQFGLQQLMLCTFLCSLLLSANFFENPYSPFRLFEMGTFTKSDPKIFGFPFEVVRIPRGANQTPVINWDGVVMNVLFLVIFVMNILVLKFRASEAKQD